MMAVSSQVSEDKTQVQATTGQMVKSALESEGGKDEAGGGGGGVRVVVVVLLLPTDPQEEVGRGDYLSGL